jgi:hypothetical protein
MKNSGIGNIGDAIRACAKCGLNGWPLVEYAQKLVSRRMKYSYSNSLDFPAGAFEKGMGYCWHQASSLNSILRGLGFKSRMVHAVRNRFPDKLLEGTVMPGRVSGHVWCRVTLDGEEKDVCPGDEKNVPGRIHFTLLSPVRDWNIPVCVFSYLGSAALNWKRYREFRQRQK